jgi:hypothetical protein
MAYGYSKQDKIEHSQIIMGKIKDILSITDHHLRFSERILMVDGNKQIVETEDTRISFCQAVEMLAYSCRPYFDEKMSSFYNDNIDYLQGFGWEIMEKLPEGELKKRINELQGEKKEDLLITWQVRVAKKLFIELTDLLKREDFLKGSTYSEDEDFEEVEIQ